MRKSKLPLITTSLMIILLLGAFGYVYQSEKFERVAPVIEFSDKLNWNMKEPFRVGAKDNVGIKKIEVILEDDGKYAVIASKEFQTPEQSVELFITPKDFNTIQKFVNPNLRIKVTDFSYWNIFGGNTKEVISKLSIDRVAPILYTIANSSYIKKGGSALVIFKADDENLDSVYVKTSYKDFVAQPFYKKGFFIALLAWPVTENTFSAQIVVTDKAKNQSKQSVSFYQKNVSFRTSAIQVKQNFLDGKITELFMEYSNIKDAEPLDRFIFVNENLRKENEILINKFASVIDPFEVIEDFALEPFYPLPNGKNVAPFGDHRLFQYSYADPEDAKKTVTKQISESYHLGIDLASVEMANIISSNRGKVIFANMNGIYGNMMMLNHGLGLCSLYAHCSKMNFNEGEFVEANSIIATSGKTGLALGDHLHFGVLVQGIEVNPLEWMDKEWMHNNVFEVINSSKKLIDGRI